MWDYMMGIAVGGLLCGIIGGAMYVRVSQLNRRIEELKRDRRMLVGQVFQCQGKLKKEMEEKEEIRSYYEDTE